MIYEVKVTNQAFEQMKEIVNYISNELFAPEAASALLDEIQGAISSLEEFPNKHSLVDDEPWRSEGVRRIVVKNFLVYFWVDDENSRVQVTAVIYEKRNQLAQLIKMDMGKRI